VLPVLCCRRIISTTAEGAATVVMLAADPDSGAVTGKFFAEGKEIPSSDESYDEAKQQRLWAVSERITGLEGKTVIAAAV
jgi:hypothetical protein